MEDTTQPLQIYSLVIQVMPISLSKKRVITIKKRGVEMAEDDDRK